MKLVKQIGYKLIVTLCIVMTFCCFIASAPVEASKVSTGEFYYSGTTKGTYTVNKGFLEKLIDALGEILDYLFGLATMGIRIVFVGWTVLLERCLTWILEGATGENVDIDSMGSTAMTPANKYITLEAIFFNRVPLLDINIFDLEVRTDVSPLGEELETTSVTPTSQVVQGKNNKMSSGQTVVQGKKKFFNADTTSNDSLIIILKKTIASWYYTFRLISIMIMLVLLVFIGIKITIQSSASEKALYKRVLVDWLVGMILVFSIHYIMFFIIQFNEVLVTQISNVAKEENELEIYEYGLKSRADEPPTNAEIEASMYEQVRTRAYDARMSVGFTGMIMYMVLVFYAWKYTFIYLKRYLTVAILMIVAPIVALTYAFNKVQTGKSQIFTRWLKEFFFMVILQSIHAIIYVVFVDTALALSLSSISGMIIAFVTLHFVGKAEQIFRTIFNIQGSLTNDIANGGTIGDLFKSFKAAATTMGAFTLGKSAAKLTLRATTKPIRMAGNAAFAGAMKIRAKKFGGAKNYESLLDERDAQRIEKQRKGNIGNQLVGNSIKNFVKHPFSKQKRGSTVKDLEKELAMLKVLKGKTYLNEDGEETEVTDELIERKEAELNEVKEINQHKLKWALKYNTIGKGSRWNRGRWQNILNPYQYVEEDEDGKYHAVKVEREKNIFYYKEKGEDGKYHTVKVEHNKGLIYKKKDSVGKRFLAHFQTDPELKKALKSQIDILKSQVFGFAGILVGLPALIAEPKLGVALLGMGIASSTKVYGRSQNFKDVKILAPGQKFRLKGFAGASEQTIANTALQLAREQMLENDETVIEQYNRTVTSVKSKISGGNLRLGNNSRRKSTFESSGFKVVRLNNISAAYVKTCRVANKLNKKVNDAQKADADDFIEMLADKYYEMEADRDKAAFSNLYLAITDRQAKEVDNMSIQEVRRELGYKEEIEVVRQADGKVTLTADSEKAIIDNAIIEVAQKSGIIDISELDLSNKNIEQISNTIIKALREKKILDKDSDVSSIIDNLEKKIKDRQAKLATEGTSPVEEKMADEAIIAVMKEQNITDPSKVSQDAVMEKYQEIYSSTARETTKQSTSVAEQMRAQKPEGSNESSSPAKKVIDEDRAKRVISDRSKTLSHRASSTVESEELRTALKRKKQTDLDATILETQEMLDTATTPEVKTDDSSKTDDVLRLLNYQTAMHKSTELVQANKTSREKKLKAFRAELFDQNGSIRTEKSLDGSRQVVVRDGTRITMDGSRRADRSKRDGSMRVDSSGRDGSRRVEEILIDLKSGRK